MIDEQLNKDLTKLRFLDENGEMFPDWEEKKLSDVSTIIGGGTPSTGNESYWNGNINWFSPAEIKTKYVTQSDKKITKEGLSKSSAKMLPIGTVIVTTRATLGRMAILNEPSSTNQGFQSVITGESLNNEFFYYHQPLIEKFCISKAGGSTFKEVSKNQFVKYNLFLPSLPEQKLIANFLSKLDEKIEQQSNLVELLRKQKQGYSQRLFNGSLRFKKDNGTDYEDWEEKKLGEVITAVKYEKVKNPTSFYLLTVKLHMKGVVPTLNHPNGVEKGRPYYKRKKGELLIGRQNFHNGGFGLVTDESDGYISSNAISGYKATNNNNISYIMYYFQINHKKYSMYLEGTGQKEIPQKAFDSSLLLIPSLPEQEKIVEFLSSLDNRIDKQLNKLEQLKLEKQSYMQKVLV